MKKHCMYVAAIAALLMSYATHLTPAEIRQLLIDTCTPVEALSDQCVSGGIVSASRAISALYKESRPAYSRGDPSGDGEITSLDYIMVKRTVLGTYSPSETQIPALDADGNGTVNATDYIMVKRHVFKTYYVAPW